MATIIVPIHQSAKHHYHTNTGMHFIKLDDDRTINLGAVAECGVYKSYGSWWIWFKVEGNYRYYYPSFETRDEAEKILCILLEETK